MGLIQDFFPPALMTRSEKSSVFSSGREGIRQSDRPPSLANSAICFATLSLTLLSLPCLSRFPCLIHISLLTVSVTVPSPLSTNFAGGKSSIVVSLTFLHSASKGPDPGHLSRIPKWVILPSMEQISLLLQPAYAGKLLRKNKTRAANAILTWALSFT